MQFKLGKHMTPADMMRQEGRKLKHTPHVMSHDDWAREFRKSGDDAEDWNEGMHAWNPDQPEHMDESDYKSERRNTFRVLKNFGKQADEKRKKMEGRGGNPFNQKGATWNYGEHAAKRVESEKKHEGTKCEQCGKSMNPVEAAMNPVCGKCARENHEKAMGRGGYSYKDIHKTPLSKLVGATHGHKHVWDDSDPEKMPYCEICGKSMEEADPKEYDRRDTMAQMEYERQKEEGEGRGGDEPEDTREYEIHGKYGSQYGWEPVHRVISKKEALRALHDYDENEREYPHKLVRIFGKKKGRGGGQKNYAGPNFRAFHKRLRASMAEHRKKDPFPKDEKKQQEWVNRNIPF